MVLVIWKALQSRISLLSLHPWPTSNNKHTLLPCASIISSSHNKVLLSDNLDNLDQFIEEKFHPSRLYHAGGVASKLVLKVRSRLIRSWDIIKACQVPCDAKNGTREYSTVNPKHGTPHQGTGQLLLGINSPDLCQMLALSFSREPVQSPSNLRHISCWHNRNARTEVLRELH